MRDRLQNRDLVLFSLEPLGNVRRRNGHIISFILSQKKFNRVIWVNPSTRPLSGEREKRLQRIDKLVRFTPIKIVPERFINLSFFALWLQWKLLYLYYRIKKPAYWLNNLEWFRIASPKRSVLYDVTDDWLAEPNVNDEILKKRLYRENFIIQNCKHVTLCSRELIERKCQKIIKEKFTYIPNGVEKEKYLNERLEGNFRWSLLENEAVYVGSLHESRLDIQIICELAKSLMQENYGMTLLGPNFLASQTKALLVQHGVKFIDEVSHIEVPKILDASGVLIVPHLVNEFTDSLDPLKLYELLCSKTITVSTEVAGFRDFPSEIRVCSREDFVSTCLKVLREKSKREPTPQYAHDWGDVGKKFIQALEQAI